MMTHFRSDQMTEMRKVNKLAPNFCFYRKKLSIKMSHEEKAREEIILGKAVKKMRK